MPSKKMIQPTKNCKKCPRIHHNIKKIRQIYPDWHNSPVRSFGEINSELLIVGLAPGFKGANRTGRPFTGDFSGKFLFSALEKFGFLQGKYDADGINDFTVKNCRITNAVRCFPPENTPTSSEIKNCAIFLNNEIRMMENLKIILALGGVAHRCILTILEKQKSRFKFGHNNLHEFERFHLIDSFHCSRYNVNTGRLTANMFDDVFRNIQQHLN